MASCDLKRLWLAATILICLTAGTAAVAQIPAQTPVQTPASPSPLAVQTAPAAKAPAPETEESRKLDQIADTLKQIETGLHRHNISPKNLQVLQDRATPLVAELQNTVAHLQIPLAAIKARLDQLGPPPAAKDASENPQVAQERQAQQRAYDNIDSLLKRAKLLAVQADQVGARINQRQRAKFTYSLFARGPSVANPGLWLDVIEAMPRNLRIVRSTIGDWIGAVDTQLAKARRETAFWTLVVAVLILYWPLSIFAERRLTYKSNTARPGRLRKILAAWWAAAVIIGCPVLAFLAIAAIAQGFGLFDAARQAVFWVLFSASFSVALAAGLTRGLLAPAHPNWRLIDLGNESCRYARAAILAVAVICAASYVILSLSAASGADQTYQAALRGTGALFVALAIGAALWRNRATECESGEILGPIVAEPRDWYGLLRIVLWIAAVTIIVAVLVGFMGLAGFLADQIVWVGGIGIVAIMSLILVEEAIATGCAPTAPFGVALITTVGLRRDSIEQLAILLNGAAKVAIFVTAILFALAPWGIQSTDLPTYLHAAFFGFHVGDITISLSSVIIGLGIFVAGVMATRAIKRWLEVRFLPHTQLDIGLRNAIKTSFGYLGFALALGFALGYLGLNFQKFAIVAGALSVGIGFGLQSIVNNFVSGLILLWERAIRVGDWIVVGADEGLVCRIDVRSTEIETFDRAAVIVPNSNLISGVVKNFVRTDRTGRIQINIPINSAADPEMARDILLEIAKGHGLVLETPPPVVIFAGITASAYNFEFYCFVAEVSTLRAVKSDLNFEIHRKFKSQGLFAVPPPTSVVSLAGLEQFEPMLNKVMSAAAEGTLRNGKQTD